MTQNETRQYEGRSEIQPRQYESRSEKLVIGDASQHPESEILLDRAFAYISVPRFHSPRPPIFFYLSP
jgi:hypothetical protein